MERQSVIPTVIEDELKQSYLDYAMSVIVGRALPDARDGLKPVHRRILFGMYEMSNFHNKPFKKSARIVGECFVKDTQVLTEQGLTPIQDLRRGDIVYTHTGLGKVAELYRMHAKPLLKVTLNNGISNTVTESQKFKVINEKLEFEWKEAKNLTKNDYICVKASYPDIKECVTLISKGNKKIVLNESMAYLLGQLISNGWVENNKNRQRLGFCCNSLSVMQRIQKALSDNFGYKPKIHKKKYVFESFSGQLSFNNKFTLRVSSSEISNFIISVFNLKNASAYNKRIPAQIFRSPKPVIYSFISGLIDSNGSVHKSGSVITYSSVSEKLVDELVVLLLHLGILSKKCTQKCTQNELLSNTVMGREVKSDHAMYSLEISGRFAKLLANKLTLEYQNKLNKIENEIENAAAFTECKTSELDYIFDYMPYASQNIFSELSKAHRGLGGHIDKKGKKLKGKNFIQGVEYENGAKIGYPKDLKQCNLGRMQILEQGILAKLKKSGSPVYEKVKSIIKNRIYFLRVDKIEESKPEETYDIQVEKDHEFVANGMLSHNCLGKFHPHGDTAVYDSLVRMAQDFSLRYTLVDGQGNFGSLDGDRPAAMRYTEVRLKKIAEEILQDIDKETVEFVPNFDGTLKEPTVLPCKFPNLLVNGSSGIAVGMATNMPPHNLSEVCDAIVKVIDNPEIPPVDLIEVIQGPDFPTGALIYGKQGIYDYFKTGRGKITVRAKVKAEQVRNRDVLVVTEIPYMVNKAMMLEEITLLIKDKRIQGISDIRDESDKEGVRVVIELRSGADPNLVLNQLYKHSKMQVTFGIILLALVGNEPKVLTFKELVEQFIAHRRKIVRKRIEFDLKKAQERSHILEGLIKALGSIDEVVQKIKESRDAQLAAAMLINDYYLTEIQAKAVLEMKLQRLAALEQEKIKAENQELLSKIAILKSILADEQKILGIIKDEILELKNTYGDARRTQIMDSGVVIEDEDLIKRETVVVTISHSGYAKRMPLDTYRQQRRGGRGVIGADTKEEDFVDHLFVGSTHDYLLLFTNHGKVYWIKVYEIPEMSRQAMGRPIVNLVLIEKDEIVQAIVPVSKFDDSRFLFFATKKGYVKRAALSEFSRPRKTGIIALSLDEGDSLINVKLTDGTKNILLGTKKGMAVRFKEAEVRTMGRTARGVRGCSLRKGDEIIGMEACSDSETILSVTENGYGKRSAVSDYRLISRGGKGVINIKVNERNGDVVAIKPVVDTDELILSSRNGIMIRVLARDISVFGRNAQGVRIMRLDSNDKVVAVAKIAREET